MKKILFLVAILFAATTMGKAQDRAIALKPVVGYGFSNWFYGGDLNDFSDISDAFKVGVGVEIPFNKTWSLQTGLNFHALSTDVKYNITNNSSIAAGKLNIHQNYLDLPIQVGARIHISDNFKLLFKLGPYLAYGVGGKTKVDGVKISTFDYARNFDSGVDFTIDFEIKRFIIGLQSRMGYLHTISGISTYNSVGFLTFGYKFDLH